MNDQELDERLRAGDPARSRSDALNPMIDRLVSGPVPRRPRRGWRPVVVVGGSLALVGALVAGTDLGTVLLSIPPFAQLEHGATFRPTDGLSFVPMEGDDRGKQCKLYIDLGGLTDSQASEVRSYWSSADPAAFAIAVRERIAKQDSDSGETAETIELQASVDQILADLATVAPDIKWGTAVPGQSFAPGDPHLAAVTRSCDEPDK